MRMCHVLLPGTCVTILFLLLVMFYLVRNCWHQPTTGRPKLGPGSGKRTSQLSSLYSFLQVGDGPVWSSQTSYRWRE